MPPEKLIADYLAGPRLLREAVAGMTREELLAKPIPGAWSSHQVVCHLSDAESLYAERIKRVLAEPKADFLNMDQDLWAQHLAVPERDLEEELRLVELIRSQMGKILQTLSPADFARQGTHTTDGPLTLERLLERITGHIPHHAAFIRQKRARLAGG